jgi:hypothetical protein
MAYMCSLDSSAWERGTYWKPEDSGKENFLASPLSIEEVFTTNGMTFPGRVQRAKRLPRGLEEKLQEKLRGYRLQAPSPFDLNRADGHGVGIENGNFPEFLHNVGVKRTQRGTTTLDQYIYRLRLQCECLVRWSIVWATPEEKRAVELRYAYVYRQLREATLEDIMERSDQLRRERRKRRHEVQALARKQREMWLQEWLDRLDLPEPEEKDMRGRFRQGLNADIRELPPFLAHVGVRRSRRNGQSARQHAELLARRCWELEYFLAGRVVEDGELRSMDLRYANVYRQMRSAMVEAILEETVAFRKRARYKKNRRAREEAARRAANIY